MTMRELLKIAEMSELEVVGKYYNTCCYYVNGIIKIIFKIIQKLFPNTRESLAVLCKKQVIEKG